MITPSLSKSGKMGSEVIDIINRLEANMDKKMDRITGSIDSLRNQVTEVQSELATIKDLQNSLEFTQQSVAQVEQSITVIKDNVLEVEKRVDLLEMRSDNKDTDYKLLEQKYLNLDTYSRRENLKFSSLKEDDNEQNNVTISKIRDLFTNELKITDAVNIKFQRCHRLSQRSSNANNSRDVIVRFAFYPDREMVWERRSKLKNTEVVMSEDFPPDIEKRRSKLYPIYKLAKKKNHKAKLVTDRLIIDGISYTVDTLDKLPQDIHPKQLAERHTEKVVLFYGAESPFSNFYKAQFSVGGQLFNSSEQFFQYQKALSAEKDEIAAKILKTKNPIDQYLLGKKIIPDEAKWNVNKAKEVMEIANRAKFDQNQQLKKELLDTGNKIITECNPHDKFWSGISLKEADDLSKWKGGNALGIILCKLRDSFK